MLRRALEARRCRLLAVAALACLPWLLDDSQAAAAPGWLAPVDLSAPGRDATNPAVAVDDAGNTVAVWERQNIISNNVQVSTRIPGADFSAPIDISTQAQNPAVAMTPGGEAVVAWWHFANPPGNYVLEVSTRPPGGAFSPPVQVASFPVGVIPQALRLAVGPGGDVALAWIKRDSPEPTEEEEENEEEPGPVAFVEASVRPAGGGFSPPVAVSPQPLEAERDASEPSVAVDPAGNAIVAWAYDEVAPEPEEVPDRLIEAAFQPAGSGEFSVPEQLSQGGAGASSPDVAMDAGGNAIVVWSRPDGEDAVVQAANRPPGGEFSSPPDDLSASGGKGLGPEVAVTPAGEATVVWTMVEASVRSIQATTRPPGGSFPAAQDVSAVDEEPIFPTLAKNGSGGAVVAWSGTDGVNDVVRASVRPAGGGFSPPEAVSAPSPGFLHPGSAIDGAGNASVVWSRSNGSNDIVQAAGYDANPPGFRGVAIPSQGIVGTPIGFSADPFDAWPIAATVFDFGDGSAVAGTSVSHAYSAPGSYLVTVTATDRSGNTVTAAGTIAIAPLYDFRIGKHRRNRKRGIVFLTVHVSGPGRVEVRGRQVKRRVRRSASAGKVRIPVLARRKALKRLRRRGKARVRVAVAFRPDGGTRTARRRILIVLIKKRRGTRKHRVVRHHVRPR